MARFCVKCGYKLNNDVSFCPNCGAVQNMNSFDKELTSQTEYNNFPHHKSDNNPFPYFLIALFSILALVDGLFLLISGGDINALKTVSPPSTQSQNNIPSNKTTSQVQPSKPSNKTPTNSQTKSSDNITAGNKLSSSNDLSLGNVSVGDSISALKAKKGNPNKVVTENGVIHWKYSDIDVTIVNDTISTLITESSAVSTPRGIHENSPIGEVFTKYGNNYRYEVYNNIQLYEYPITSKDGAPCLLRFAVKNGENRVYYISMRKLQ